MNYEQMRYKVCFKTSYLYYNGMSHLAMAPCSIYSDEPCPCERFTHLLPRYF